MEIKRLSRFPYTVRHSLLDYSRHEFETMWQSNTARLWKISQCIWQLSVKGTVVCYAGLIKTSIIGSGAEFWFLAAKGLPKHLLATVHFIRRAMRRFVRVFPNLRIAVEVQATRQYAFAQLLGFRPKQTINNMIVLEYRKV